MLQYAKGQKVKRIDVMSFNFFNSLNFFNFTKTTN